MNPNRIAPSGRQSGIAAIELAIVVPILLILITVPLFYGRYFWHYTIAQKAAQDAARYMSAVSVAEMRSTPLAAAAQNLARDLARAELAEVANGAATPKIDIFCDTGECYGNGFVPATVRVRVRFQMVDNIFGAVSTGANGLDINADVTVRYVGS